MLMEKEEDSVVGQEVRSRGESHDRDAFGEGTPASATLLKSGGASDSMSS